ncbi:hypothetical protein MYAM1_000135 [Malassezia yamatoensis]|uniref:Uncharacterized protein n=1 Tax=Malassezia yamatoensis TaxID=253288 RepID=A0AAJ6CEN3_9BASI|nr:hypothetical protein MYAM1_000135 [Malassezia yamatoensis]
MTPGFENRFDQPYSIYATQENPRSSAAYANQPPPGPPPEHSYKPELLSGFPNEAPPSYVETEHVQAPPPTHVIS